jgi:hypothetical protein
MDYYVQESNILFLPEIDISEYKSMEDKIDEKLLELVNINDTYDYSNYNKTNIKYMSDGKWPMQNNLHCWYCDFTFDNDSIFIPIYIKECLNGGLEFGIKGCMCTFNCAMSIILSTTHYGSADRWKYINNLKILYFIKNGVYISDIKPAPCKYNLKKYGGEWTNEKFWEELKNLDIYGGLKDHDIKLTSLSKKERIDLVFNNFTAKNKRNVRIIDNEEDDCVIFNGNRISLSKNSIWKLSDNDCEKTYKSFDQFISLELFDECF